MKKPLLIIIGAVITLIIILVWIYLMFFTNGNARENLFTEFVGGAEDTFVAPAPIFVDETIIDLDRAPLRQLTTRPIAGFGEVTFGTSTKTALYYVEKGTGHVYSIDTTTGEEQRLSGTTFAQTNTAVISDDGAYVAISINGNSKDKRLVLGNLDLENNVLEEIFTTEAYDYSLSENNELLFTTPESKGLVAYSYDTKNQTKKEIFILPFYEANIQWGSKAESKHYVYPKTSYALEGYLYEIEKGKLKRLPVGGYGFSALVGEEDILFSVSEAQKSNSYAYNFSSKVTKPISLTLLPEKCSALVGVSLFTCPYDESITNTLNLPDSWYTGELILKDSIWRINPDLPPGGRFIDPFLEIGRELDIVGLSESLDFTSIYFSNKNDNTLWMYEF